MTGRSRSVMSRRIRCRISLPSMPGSEMSSSTRSGRDCAMPLNASVPLSYSTRSNRSPRMACRSKRLSALSSTTANVVMTSGGSVGRGADGLQLLAGFWKVTFDAANVLSAPVELTAARQLLTSDTRLVHRERAELAGTRLEAVQGRPERRGVTAVEGFACFRRLGRGVLDEQLDHAANELLTAEP